MQRLRQIAKQILPNGKLDAVRQVLLFVGAYVLYQIVRGLVNGNDVAKASWNATKVIDLSTCSSSRASSRGRCTCTG